MEVDTKASAEQRCDSMKAMQISIRRIGNSQGIVIPKPILAQVGLVGSVEMTAERGAIVLQTREVTSCQLGRGGKKSSRARGRWACDG
jgi:hypothetical protein